MSSELNALDGVPEQVKLSTGTFVEVQDLKSRQFFKLLRIITHGALPLMNDMSLFRMSSDMSATEFGQRLLSVMLLSIPDAEKETIEFLQSMVKPAGLIEGRNLNKQDTERNSALWAAVDADMYNPELDDLVTLVETIIRREASDIQALGKRLQAMFKLAEKTGQVPNLHTSPEANSSADSREASTSSRPSTDGPTTSSGISVSGGSDNAQLLFENGASTSSGSVNNG